MTATVLMFNLPGKKKRAVRVLSESLGFAAREMKPEDFGKSLAALLGDEEAASGAEAEETAFAEEMLVLCDLDAGQFHGLLDGLQEAGARIALKASLTDTNRGWTPGRLCRELTAEREAIEKLRRERR